MYRIFAPLILSSCAFAAITAHAQKLPEVNTAHLSGTVTDPQGAVIPGAAITVQSAGQSVTAIADAGGRYTLPALPPEIYTVTVTAPGFAAKPLTGIKLAAHETKQLDLTLTIDVQQQQVQVNAASSGSTPRENGDAVVLRASDLAALSPDSRQLQQQIQAVGGGDSPQIYIDGFSGGKLPPKDSIREIRINQNPYSTEYDDIGLNRIEVFTKPGSDMWHGYVYSGGTDSVLDSRDPYSVLPQPFSQTQSEGGISGPIVTKIASFNVNGGYYRTQNSSIVDAETLNAANQQTALTQTVSNPSSYTTVTPRFDAQLGKNNTLTARYEYDLTSQANYGAGQLVLASETYNSNVGVHTAQISDTTVLSPKALNELRFQYIRTGTAQAPSTLGPTIIVEGAFTGGGNNLGTLTDHTDRYELQDYGTIDLGKHSLRVGVRQRFFRDANYATAGYNGEYIFPTLAAYQATLQGVAAGLNPTQIRAAGGGANQFNISAGDPAARVLLADSAVFAEDTWKALPNLSVSYGVRVEGQNHVHQKVNATPRFGFSWDLGKTEKKPPLFTVQGGFGLFFQRLPSIDLLQVARLNGVRQVQYVINQPDTFPSLPASNQLSGQTPSTSFFLSPTYKSPYLLQAGVSVSHAFKKAGTVTVSYTSLRGVHLLLQRNVNAPLPGTYNPADPASGTRPYGSLANINEYDTSGVSRRNRLDINGRLEPLKGLMIFTRYRLSYSQADTSGGFPSNQYNIGADYGRAGYDVRHRLFLGANYDGPWGLNGGPFLIAQTGAPFDIVLGNDSNGDSQFNNRPAYATDLTRASVIRTRYGNFDTAPIAGQTIIPHNAAPGPGLVYLNLQLNRAFHFGPVVKPPEGAPAPEPVKPGSKPKSPDKRFTLNMGMYAENILNHNNPAAPIGTLGSPLFGLSNALNGTFSDGSANRIVAFQTYFQF